MCFLDKTLERRETLSNIANTSNVSCDVQINDDSVGHDDIGKENSNSENEELQPKRPKISTKQKNNAESAVVEALQVWTSKQSGSDEFDAFGKYVAGSLRKLSKRSSNYATFKINEILYQCQVNKQLAMPPITTFLGDNGNTYQAL